MDDFNAFYLMGDGMLALRDGSINYAITQLKRCLMAEPSPEVQLTAVGALVKLWDKHDGHCGDMTEEEFLEIFNIFELLCAIREVRQYCLEHGFSEENFDDLNQTWFWISAKRLISPKCTQLSKVHNGNAKNIYVIDYYSDTDIYGEPEIGVTVEYRLSKPQEKWPISVGGLGTDTITIEGGGYRSVSYRSEHDDCVYIGEEISPDDRKCPVVVTHL
jgi:hypothetical protein